MIPALLTRISIVPKSFAIWSTTSCEFWKLLASEAYAFALTPSALSSFSTAIACVNTKRNFIGIELDAHYFTVGTERLEKHIKTLDYSPKIVFF